MYARTASGKVLVNAQVFKCAKFDVPSGERTATVLKNGVVYELDERKGDYLVLADTYTVHDFLPGFDSYIAQVESNFEQLDPEQYEEYLKSREYQVNVVIDLLNDFGTCPMECGHEERERLTKLVAKKHVGLC